MSKLTTSPIWALAAVAVLGMGLAACSSSDDPAPPPPPPPPVDTGPTAYEAGKAAIMAADTAEEARDAYDDIDLSEVSGDEAASLMMALNDRLAAIAADNAYADGKAAIMAAETAEAAQAAYDAIDKDAVSGAEATSLAAALETRKMEIATAGRIEMQRQALMAAAGMIDTSDMMTAEEIVAANAAIAALKRAIAAAVDVDDTSMYQTQVDTAEGHVMASQSALDHAGQTMVLMNAVDAVKDLDLTGLSTQEAITAANTVITALKTALENATELSDAEKAEAMTVLATADRTVMAAQVRVDTASQRVALSTAVEALRMIDLNDLMTQDDIDKAERAIIALDEALKAATNLTDAEKLDATVDVTVAKRRLASAQTALDGNVGSQRTALMNAGNALAAIDLDDLDTQAKIDAADTAVKALETALNAATHLSDSEKSKYQTQLSTARETVRTAQTGMDKDGRMMAQRTAIKTTVEMARTAVGKVDDDSTDAEVTAAETALENLKKAIEGAEDLPEGDTEVAGAQGTYDTLVGQLSSAKSSRKTAMDEDNEKRNQMLGATAAKLYAGIKQQEGAVGDVDAAGEVFAAYNDADTAITVTTWDTTLETPAVATATLSEDKKTMVADLHGWEGKRYADPAGGHMYEAIVYSNVGEPERGDKFGQIGVGTPVAGYQYGLSDAGQLAVNTSGTAAYVDLIDGSNFDQTAGVKRFPLPDPNPGQATVVSVPGSFHGVSGTYTCTPGGAVCAANLSGDGFQLGTVPSATVATFTDGGGTWMFKPSNPEARVMESADDDYASYGWWIRKADNDGPFTASAFVDVKGTVDAAAGLGALDGKATYRGGAAGKYALRSSTGGTNDAGRFTARATLEADFSVNDGTNTDGIGITGTLDMFMGADGQSRDWEVQLKGSSIGDTGVIGNDGASTTSPGGTVWTIGDTAAGADGNWAGNLRDNNANGVPQVATGTFYSTYDGQGRMVGGFGANLQ